MCFHFRSCRVSTTRCVRKAAPIVDVLADPAIPPGTQWGTFLRNHDELTLEMVSPEERAAMYGWYAPDPRMRANVGIRRRLAPLLDNSRPEIELIHALILSLPGSPCLYYGDEIGMGDNIWLTDRDAVRTPMQWTPDRNSGFSSVDPGKLYLPVISSLVYHYNNVNVEAQMASSASLLHWVRGMLQVRSRHRSSASAFSVVGSTTGDPRLRPFVRGRQQHPVRVGPLRQQHVQPSPGRDDPAAGAPRRAQLIDLFGGSGFPGRPDGRSP